MEFKVFENEIKFSELVTTGSILKINKDYDESCFDVEEVLSEKEEILGAPVKSLEIFKKETFDLNCNGLIHKKRLIDGGGKPLNNSYTVTFAYSGYWENEPKPFDFKSTYNPEVADLKENGLLPGLQMALESMRVGEVSAFLLSYKVMFGEMGVPPRIKPKSDCVFYIRLIKAKITPKENELELTPFQKVYKEVKINYQSGLMLYKCNNFNGAVRLFKKSIMMLHKCRLADEQEEKLQERMLIKLYLNSAVCYNSTKEPLKACIACNELNRYNKLWNNAKALYHNAKALRTIGNFDGAEKRLRAAIRLSPNCELITKEMSLLQETREIYNKSKLYIRKTLSESISDDFKKEVDEIIDMFKKDENTFKLLLPTQLSLCEREYIKSACYKANLFFDKIDEKCAMGKDQLADDDFTDIS